jgi:hypothetical protein
MQEFQKGKKKNSYYFSLKEVHKVKKPHKKSANSEKISITFRSAIFLRILLITIL